jgi:hypothetical protein
MFKGILEGCSPERGPLIPPSPLGISLCLCSELGGAEPASDSPTHGQTSCLKISAGKWYRGGARLTATLETTPQPYTHTHTHTHTHTGPHMLSITALFLQL